MTSSTKSRKNLTKPSESIIRIEISGELDVQDLSQIYSSIDSVYRMLFCVEELERYLTENPTVDDRTIDLFPEQKSEFSQIIHSYDKDAKKAVVYITQYDKYQLEDPDVSKKKRLYIPTLGYFRLENKKYFAFRLATVLKTSHSSPGFTDIIGLAKTIKLLKETITYYLPNKKDKEQIEILRQERLKKLIHNLKSIGFSDIQIRELILNNDKNELKLKNIIEERKITDAK